MLFKKEKKQEVLKGRTIRYLIKEKMIACTEVHLYNVLNGKTTCSYLLAKNILECVGDNAVIEDYFEDVEK